MTNRTKKSAPQSYGARFKNPAVAKTFANSREAARATPVTASVDFRHRGGNAGSGALERTLNERALRISPVHRRVAAPFESIAKPGSDTKYALTQLQHEFGRHVSDVVPENISLPRQPRNRIHIEEPIPEKSCRFALPWLSLITATEIIAMITLHTFGPCSVCPTQSFLTKQTRSSSCRACRIEKSVRFAQAPKHKLPFYSTTAVRVADSTFIDCTWNENTV